MFLTKTSTTIHGKTYTHYKIVESIREAGRVKHRVLWSFGNLTEEQAQQIRAVLAVTHGTEWVSAPFAEIAVTRRGMEAYDAEHTLWYREWTTAERRYVVCDRQVASLASESLVPASFLVQVG
jgi:hypothetical protein